MTRSETPSPVMSPAPRIAEILPELNTIGVVGTLKTSEAPVFMAGWIALENLSLHGQPVGSATRIDDSSVITSRSTSAVRNWLSR